MCVCVCVCIFFLNTNWGGRGLLRFHLCSKLTLKKIAVKNVWLQFLKTDVFYLLFRLCMWIPSSWGEWASHCSTFPSCGPQALGAWASVVVAPGLSSAGSAEVAMGSSAPWHVGSSWTRDWSNVPCITRWLLNNWTTRKAHGCSSELSTYKSLIW